MEAVFFPSEQAFRQWLAQNHATQTVLLLGIYKKASGKPTVTYKQAVDQALCFGWIDGVGGTIDEQRYTVRFTQRKPRSIWSQVNIRRVAELSEAGLMHPYGLEVFNARDLSKQNLYANEQQQIELSAAYAAQFRANSQAWENFQAQPPGYRRNAIWWVISAKQEATRLKRLATLIEDSAAGRKIKSLTPRSKREKE